MAPMITVRGILMPYGDIVDSTKSIINVKYLTIKVIDDDSVQTIANIQRQYANFSLPVQKDYPGWKVMIKTRTLLGRIDYKELPRDQWQYKYFDVVFGLQYYAYGGNRGYNFQLEKMTLV